MSGPTETQYVAVHVEDDHLTPGLAEVRVYAAGLTSFLAGLLRFRAGGLAGIPAL